MERYRHQICFKKIGEKGQKTLSEKKVLIIGCGALGSAAANNLARAGVGYLKIVDRDYVEISDLQRQILFDENDVNKRLPKAVAVLEKLKKINSTVKIESLVEDVNESNIDEMVEGFNLVLDGTDNLETRFLINTVCIKHGIPWIYVACLGSSATLMNIMPDGPCLRCLIPLLPTPGSLGTCETSGVVNAVPLVIASIQTTEALKILLNDKDILKEVLFFDLWNNEYKKLKIKKRSDCPICVKKEFVLKHSKIIPTTTLCGRNAFQIYPSQKANISTKELNAKIGKIAQSFYNEYLMAFKIDDKEITVFNDGRAIIKGVKDAKEAKSLYAKYVGV